MKKCVDDLAIFGGSPESATTLHVGRPNLGNLEVFYEKLTQILGRNWLTNNGPVVEEFETALCEHLGVEHAIAVCNGTLALEIACRVLGFRGEVIVPSFTFVACAHALKWQEVTPVFCEVDRATHNIDPRSVERLITRRTSGILAVHLWGRPCAIEELQDISRRTGLPVLYDASHGFAGTFRGKSLAQYGSLSVYSFHATKFVHSMEGGAIVTNDGSLADTVRLMKNFGFRGLDDVVHLGTNAKMSEMNAAMGLASLRNIDHFIAVNRGHYDHYRTRLDGVPGMTVIDYPSDEISNFQYVVCEIDQEAFGLSRDDTMRILHGENIRARRYFYPGCHRMEPYRTLYPDAAARLPETESLAARVLCMPTGAAVGSHEVERICDVLCFIHENRAAIRTRLGK